MKQAQIGTFILISIVGILLLLLLSFGGLAYTKYFAPKYKAIERDVWEQTPSRIHGATQEISRRMIEYNRATDYIEKNAICSSLRTQYSNLNPDVIDDTVLRNFFKKCKYGEN